MSKLFKNWQHEITKRKIRDQKGLQINLFFRHSAFTTVNLLSSVFIFQLGSKYFLGGGVVNGLLLVILHRMHIKIWVMGLVIWVGNSVIRNIGYRRSIRLSAVLGSMTLMLYAVMSSTENFLYLIPAAILIALDISLYWVTYLTLFSDDTRHGHIGESVGRMEALTKLGQAIMPLIGAFIAAWLGFEILFFSLIFLLFISVIPTFFLKHHVHLDEVSWKEFFNWCKEVTFIRAGLAIGGHGIDEEMYFFIWPVAVFMVASQIEDLGWFGFVTLLATAIFSYFVARMFDRRGQRIYHVIGVVGASLAWVFRLFVTSFSQILVIDGVDKFFIALTRTYFISYSLKRAKGKQSFSFMVYWELWKAWWSLVGLFALMCVLVLWQLKGFWVMVAVLGGLGLALTLFIQDDYKPEHKKI